MRDETPYGVLVEFDSPEPLVEAVKAARAGGFTGLDAFTPFPIEGLAEALGFGETRIPWIALLGGIGGAVTAYAMQVIANLHYRLDIGGRPHFPPQAFALITFELTVLGAVGSMIVALFLMCRLPKLYHPLFGVERFQHATVDGYFLLVPLRGTANDKAAAEALLLARGPRSIVEIA